MSFYFSFALFLVFSWSHMSFSSTNKHASVLSWFCRQIDFVHRLSELEVSILNPSLNEGSESAIAKPFNAHEKKLSDTAKTWLGQYMRRFYDKATNFHIVDSIVQNSFTKDSTIQTRYTEIQEKWNDQNMTYYDLQDMTYHDLQERIKKLVAFYHNYKDIFQTIATPPEKSCNTVNKKISSSTYQPQLEQSNISPKKTVTLIKNNRNRNVFCYKIPLVIFAVALFLGLVLLKIRSTINTP